MNRLKNIYLKTWPLLSIIYSLFKSFYSFYLLFVLRFILFHVFFLLLLLIFFSSSSSFSSFSSSLWHVFQDLDIGESTHSPVLCSSRSPLALFYTCLSLSCDPFILINQKSSLCPPINLTYEPMLLSTRPMVCEFADIVSVRSITGSDRAYLHSVETGKQQVNSTK